MRFVLLGRLSLLLALGLPAAAQEFVTLVPAEPTDAAWSAAMAPATAPPRDGEPVTALKWQVARTPAPNSPVLLGSWLDVQALRFWLHLDQSYPFSLNLVLMGGGDGYHLAAIPLDFTGWKQITVPMTEFKPVRNSDLGVPTRFGFRAQGYGQPTLDPDMVIWVDQLEVQPKEGAALAKQSLREMNVSAWDKLAAEGNPMLLLQARLHEKPIAPYQPMESVDSHWQYVGRAGDALSVAWSAAAPESPHRGRPDLVEHAIAAVDWLVAAMDAEGWWFRKTPPAGDVNVNRFTLGPLLDAVRYLRMLPEGEAAWPRWRDKLNAAVEFQRRAYRAEIDYDWGGLAGGEYANQDLYYVLIMALSAMLFERPADQDEAHRMLLAVADNLLPGGGIHYIGVDNEAPVYHALNLVLIARYATLTDDPAARKLLADTVDYWPLTLTQEAYPEYWSDVWWKQTWGDTRPEGIIIAAGATEDARNRHLMWQSLARQTPSSSGMWTIYAAPYWPGEDRGTPLPAQYLVPDPNIRGARGRDGNWTFGVLQGRGLRNTFVGGMIAEPDALNPVRATFRGAQIDVRLNDKQVQGLYLSQIDDRTGLAIRPDRAAAVGARYRLQKSTINGVPKPETPDTPWQVTQVWRAAGDGILGFVAVEAMEDAEAHELVGRLALGPADPIEQDGLWKSGPLRVKLLKTFGTVGEGPVPGYARDLNQQWHGVELRQPLGQVTAGTRWVYAAWIGPESASPPDSIHLLDHDTGFTATLPDGRRVGVVFNPESRTQLVPVRWTDYQPRVFAGEDGAEPETEAARGTLEVKLAPGACALLAWE